MTASDFEQTRLRRNLLKLSDNPDTNLDYVSSFTATLQLADVGSPVKVTIDYVPGRHIVAPSVLTAYLESIESYQWDSLEHTASTLLNDFNNELVCRWVRITLALKTKQSKAQGIQTRCILIEDSQPGWNNEALISRIISDVS